MTETDWLSCCDPTAMLDFLGERAGGRKLRLFACACCRRIWPMLADERSRKAVEIAEGYADGMASGSELGAARIDAEEAADELTSRSIDAGTGPDGPAVSAAAAAMNAADDRFEADDPEGSAPFYAASNAHLAVSDTSPSGASAELAAQCRLLRDIVGNPFRPTSLDSSRLAAGVRDLARVMYDRRSFERMPELARALEQAGCTNEEVLRHCRQEGEHVRGCWVVDIILDRK